MHAVGRGIIKLDGLLYTAHPINIRLFGTRRKAKRIFCASEAEFNDLHLVVKRIARELSKSDARYVMFFAAGAFPYVIAAQQRLASRALPAENVNLVPGLSWDREFDSKSPQVIALEVLQKIVETSERTQKQLNLTLVDTTLTGSSSIGSIISLLKKCSTALVKAQASIDLIWIVDADGAHLSDQHVRLVDSAGNVVTCITASFLPKGSEFKVGRWHSTPIEDLNGLKIRTLLLTPSRIITEDEACSIGFQSSTYGRGGSEESLALSLMTVNGAKALAASGQSLSSSLVNLLAGDKTSSLWRGIRRLARSSSSTNLAPDDLNRARAMIKRAREQT